MATDGLTTIPSSFGPKDTAGRLEAEIKARGMTVFAQIDHAAGAGGGGFAAAASTQRDSRLFRWRLRRSTHPFLLAANLSHRISFLLAA